MFPLIQPMPSPLVVAQVAQTPVLVKRRILRFVPAFSVEVPRDPLYRAKNLDDSSYVPGITTEEDSTVLAQLAEPVTLVQVNSSSAVSDDEDVLPAIVDEGLTAEEWNKMAGQERRQISAIQSG